MNKSYPYWKWIEMCLFHVYEVLFRGSVNSAIVLVVSAYITDISAQTKREYPTFF
jgi:hypothetical protein